MLWLTQYERNILFSVHPQYILVSAWNTFHPSCNRKTVSESIH